MNRFSCSKEGYQLLEVKMRLLESLGQNISYMSLRHTGVREHQGELFSVKSLSHRKGDIPSAEFFQKSEGTTGICLMSSESFRSDLQS